LTTLTKANPMPPTRPPKAFAEGTDVPVERSRAELETLLAKHGATSIGMLRDNDGVLIVFEMKGRRVKLAIANPKPEDHKFSPAKQRRSPEQVQAAMGNEMKRRWRAMLLICKAKLELIASGGSAFEVEFMAHTMLPNGQTVGDVMLPRIAKSYVDGAMPPLMLGSGK
jgi:hypothetical protein